VTNNDEPTNGVKILRKKDTPNLDLSSDLPGVTSAAVIQRLKLILDKFEKGEGNSIPPQVLTKNIQYAVELIQQGTSDQRDR